MTVRSYEFQTSIETDVLPTTATVESSLAVTKNTAYTILDDDNYGTIIQTGSSNLTHTLPTLADNANRRIKFINDSTGTMTIDGEGAETISGQASFTLLNRYDSIEIISGSSSWLFTSYNYTKYSEVTGTTQTLVDDYTYGANNAARVVFTLPTTSQTGKKYKVVGIGAGGWKIAQNASQYIVKDKQQATTGTAGYLLSDHYRSCVDLICTVANTEFVVINSQGFSLIGGAFQGTLKGYCLGGFNGSSMDKIDDIVFSNDSSANIATVLTGVRSRILSGVSADLKGYFFGGYTTETRQEIFYFTFSSETNGGLTAILDTPKFDTCGVSSATKGYAMGGYTVAVTAVIEDLDFSTELSAAITATIDTASQGGCGVNSSTKGYCMGGGTASRGGAGVILSIDDLTFSSELSVRISATLGVQSFKGGNVSSTTKGYCMGRDDNNAPTATATIQALTFSGETTETLAATLDAIRTVQAGVSATLKGYAMGGYGAGNYYATIEDMIFSNDTSQAITATLDNGRSEPAGIQN